MDVFDKGICDIVTERLKNYLLNAEELKLSRIINSPRAVGDTVQEIVGDVFPKCFPENIIKEYDAAFARRAMADVAFFDFDNNYYAVDVKTHNKNTSFNMPNLTSVERLSRFYEDDHNFFAILFIEYEMKNDSVEFSKIEFIPIENISWDCLTIGALGWGQIQIQNSNILKIDKNISRVDWMIQLCDVLDCFYPKEIMKIQDRIEKFKNVRAYWEQKKIAMQ